jgi:ABC-type nitrate/sulfonate/bicarbonate transport system substrate-binding protein
MKRRQALACLAGATAFGCKRTPRQLRTIRVTFLPHYILAPVYLADELGFFREAGIELIVQQVASATQMSPLLAGGAVDVALSGPIPSMLNAFEKGAKIRIVCAREIAIAGCIHEIHGNRKSFPNGFHDSRELKGKRVSVTAPTSLSAFLLDVLLESGGLHTSDVQLLTMPLSESGPALAAGKIDAVVDRDMGLSSPEIIAGPSVADLMPGFQYNYILFGDALLQNDISTGVAFLWAYLRGVREFRAGKKPRAFEQLAAGSGLTSADLRPACLDRLSQDGGIDPSSVQRMIDWASKKGFLVEPMDASRVIDGRFVEEAQRRAKSLNTSRVESSPK